MHGADLRFYSHLKKGHLVKEIGVNSIYLQFFFYLDPYMSLIIEIYMDRVCQLLLSTYTWQ